MCATCSRIQKQRGVRNTQAEDEHHADSDQSSDSPQDSATLTPDCQSAGVITSFPPPSPHPATPRCDGSRVAGCLNNGCARSFGGNCNCAADCACNVPTSPSASRLVPILTSSNAMTDAAASATQTLSTNVSEFAPLTRAPTPRATMIPRVVLRIRPYSSFISIQTIVAMLATISGIRSVHMTSDSSTPSLTNGYVSNSETTAPESDSKPTPSSRLVVVRGDKSLDTDVFLAPIKILKLAEIIVVEQTSTAWTRKEVVLRVPDMMCPANCGTSVLNAVRVVDRVEAARLRFEQRQVVVRGDMGVDALCAAVTDIGFDSKVDAETLLPRRFRFRVDDLSDVGLNGVKLKHALMAVEGVENLVLLTDRIEVLVTAMLLDSTPLVEAASRAGFDMLELSEEAWGIPVEVVLPPSGSSSHDKFVTTEQSQAHKCDAHICPQFGCPAYMTTVAHTAALAVGWAVPGCGMASGGECTCGDSCKCEGCPEHNPVS
uniref:HMA domain-containing protein n=1 Tax=Peronospora matthiolae TaxID=2874970 RepID=A0AAV1UV82_9STRA